MRRRRNDDWDDLPAAFAAPAPAPAFRIELDLPPARRAEALRVLELVGAPAGEVIELRDLAAAAGLHAAVRAVLTDESVGHATRAAALDVAKLIETATGLDPNQGLVTPETFALVAHAPNMVLVASRYLALERTPTPEEPPLAREVIDAIPQVLPRAYEAMWRQYEDLGVEDVLRQSGAEGGPVTRHNWALGEALWVVAELLGKAGAEARVIERHVYEPSDHVIWFHDPAGRFVYEIELHPGLFWDTDADPPALTTTGSVPVTLERGGTFSVNKIDKGEEDDWLGTFQEGVQANPGGGDVVLYHGTLRDRVPAILDRGIDVGEGWGGAGTSGVFLSGSRDGALYWAKMAFLREKGEKLEAARFDRKWGARQDDLLAVLEVRIPACQLARLKADMEQAEDVGFEGDEDDWRASLREIGDVRFDGPVPAAWVKTLAP